MVERETVERSHGMIVAAYYLSRCGVQTEGKATKPPPALAVEKWHEAYAIFFEKLGDGRTPSQFRNSLKNARDAFDIVFNNGRIGWVDKDGTQPDTLGGSFQRVHDEWEQRSDVELEKFVLELTFRDMQDEGEPDLPIARTEGGIKVLVSRRRERNPKLRKQALRIHGYSCQACGFDFEKFYGEIGEEFAEVHHVVPLAEVEERETNPETDLTVLCANCHRMVHRQRGVCLSIEELIKHIEAARS